MAIYDNFSVNPEYLKVRWQEPYVSAAVNRKFFGIFPKGIYSGFVIQPSGSRSVTVGAGYLADGYGSGLTSPGYVSGNFDESAGWSIAVYQDIDAYSTTISIPASSSVTLDCTSVAGQRVYVAIDVEYVTSTETEGFIKLVTSEELDSNPSMICAGHIDVPSDVLIPITSSNIGYDDPQYPRVNPLSTPQRSGLMPTIAWELIYDRIKGTAGSTANRIPVSDGTTGKILKATAVESDGSQIGNLTGLMIGGLLSTKHASAAVQINTTTKGFLPPVMTTTQRNGIPSPATGLTIYNTTLNKVESYTGSAWNGASGYIYADLIVGSTAQVNAGLATHSTISSAITAASAGQKILILAGTYGESLSISKKLTIEGVGHSTNITGSLSFTAISVPPSNPSYSAVKNLRIQSNISIASGCNGIFVREVWQGSSGSLTNSGSANSILLIRE